MFKIKESELTKKIKKLDNQCPLSDDPLPKRAGLLWLICARKGQGKTSLLMNALKNKDMYKGYYDNIFIISPTMQDDDKCSKLVKEIEKDGNYYERLNNTTLDEIVEKIKSFNDEFDTKEEGRIQSNLIIADDCLSDLPKSTQKLQTFNKLVISLRHLKTDMWISTQKLKACSTLVRNNTDMITMYRTDSTSERKAFEDEFSCPSDLYEYCISEPYSFCHITFTSGKPIVFKKFDRVIRE